MKSNNISPCQYLCPHCMQFVISDESGETGHLVECKTIKKDNEDIDKVSPDTSHRKGK